MPSDKTREHIRCPCCGRLAILPSGKPLPTAFRADHALDAQVQTFTGGGQGAGFAWEARDLRPDELAALTGVVANIATRLRGKEIGDAPAGDLTSLNAAQLKKLHLEAIEREAAIAKARGVPALSEDVSPPDVKTVRKKWARDRELLRLAAEHIKALESENAELRQALDQG